MKKFLIIILSILCCLSFAACGSCAGCGKNDNAETKTETVSLIDKEITVYVGGTYKFAPTGADSFTYASLNESVAKVNGEGVLTGISDGVTFVDVSAGSVSVTCRVNVIKQENYIRFNADNHYVVAGGNVTVKAKAILNGKETTEKVEFFCDKTEGITFVASGENEITVTVTEKGEYVIVATSGDLRAECSIKAISASAAMLDSPKLSVEDCMTVKWKPVKNAAAYAYTINGGKEVVTDETSFYVKTLTDEMLCGDKAVFSVRAIAAAEDYEHIDGMPSAIDFAHDYEETIIDEHNCQMAGTSDFVCTVCGKTYTDKNRVDRHHYVNGACDNVIGKTAEGNDIICGFYQTAKVSYKYDEINKCYYVTGPDAGYDSEDLYICATYNDGTPEHGEKAVKYIALGAFKNNNIIKRVFLPESMTEFRDENPDFFTTLNDGRIMNLNDVEGMNGKSSPLKGNVFEGCVNLEFVSMPGVHTLPAVAASIYAHWNFRDCYNLTTVIVPEGFENRGAAFMRWGNTPANAENKTDIYVYGTYATGICDAASYPIGSDKGYGQNTLLTGDVFYFDKNAASDTCFKWKYNADGSVLSGGKHDFNGKNICRKCGAENDYGVQYRYDKDYVIGKDSEGNIIKGAYYVADNKGLTLSELEILSDYDDGVNGRHPVKFVYHGAFENNTFIKKVTLPESVATLDGLVFSGCTNLEYISMKGVKELSREEFYEDLSIDAVTNKPKHSWPAAFSRIYEDSSNAAKAANGYYWDSSNNFLDCFNLTTVIVPEGVRISGGQFTGRATKIEDGETDEEKKFKKPVGKALIYALGNKTVNIDAYEDWGNDTIRSLKDINNKGNLNNNLLTLEIYYHGEYGYLNRCLKWRYDGIVIVHSDSAHKYVNGTCVNCSEKNPNGVTYTYDFASQSYYVAGYTGSLETVNVFGTWDDGEHGEKAVTYVANGAFKDNNAIKKVILPESVTCLGGGVFMHCTNLEYVDMRGVESLIMTGATAGPDGSTERNNNFLGCGVLKTIVVGKGFNSDVGQFHETNSPDLYVYGAVSDGVPTTTDIAKVGNIYYYSESEAENCWHYDVNGNAALYQTA